MPTDRARRLALCAVGAAVLALVGCGASAERHASAPPGSVTQSATASQTSSAASTGPASVMPSTPQSTTTARPQPALPKHSLSAGDHTLTLSSGGRNRTLILHVPDGMPTGRAPLVLVYHGALDTAAHTESSTDFDQVADEEHFYVAYMQGYQDTWNEGAGHTPAERAGIDDVAFTSAALTRIEASVPVDGAKVAASGFSNGALLVQYLGCRLAGEFALIVPVSGPLPVSVSARCAPSQPVTVLAVHGTADQQIPYKGGPFVGVGGGTTVLSATASTRRWAELDGCASTVHQSTPADNVMLTQYGRCRGGVTVALRSLDGAGHDWPSDIGTVVAQALT